MAATTTTPHGALAVPGQRLAALQPLRAGVGTYVRDGSIYASIAGTCQVSAAQEISVARADKVVGSAQVLRLGDVVICKVTKVTSRQVLVDIVCVRDVVLQEAFPGTIRIEDVRHHDVDKLVMDELFSPGMLVKAAVLSYGDTRSYFLSTARPGLGVVRAVQQSGASGDVDMQ
jgi:exosome complex component CSL4